MEVVAGQGQCGHLSFADLGALGVGAVIEFGLNSEPGAGAGGCNELDDGLMAFQGAPAPIHRDVAEQPMLDFVPL